MPKLGGLSVALLMVLSGCPVNRRTSPRGDDAGTETRTDAGSALAVDAGGTVETTVDSGTPLPSDAGFERPDAGNVRGLGERCRGALCAAGLTCIGVGSAGLCQRMCRTNGDCAADGATSSCATGSTGLVVCTLACDPRTNVGCNAGRCIAQVVAGTSVTNCIGTGAGAENASCESTVDCGSGLLCATTSDTLRCRPICRVNLGNADCRLGYTCREFAMGLSPRIGSDVFGACL